MRIDSKGKYYTKVVSTSRLEVIIRLKSGDSIHGTVHIRPEKRLSDELNDELTFLSVTGAVVRRGHEVVYETSYIAVNRTTIEWVIPQQAIGEAEELEQEDESAPDVR